jgi:hypothetical protein
MKQISALALVVAVTWVFALSAESPEPLKGMRPR